MHCMYKYKYKLKKFNLHMLSVLLLLVDYYLATKAFIGKYAGYQRGVGDHRTPFSLEFFRFHRSEHGRKKFLL